MHCSRCWTVKALYLHNLSWAMGGCYPDFQGGQECACAPAPILIKKMNEFTMVDLVLIQLDPLAVKGHVKIILQVCQGVRAESLL